MINRALANRIEIWADKQFPQATQLSRANHLRIETGELIEALETGIGNIAEEVGDCMGLLLHIITHGNIDIEAELKRKLKINMDRNWGEPNEKGFVEHVRKSLEEQDHSFDRNASHTADKYVCTCGNDCDAQNDLRSLADAVMKAESILRNDLFKTRVNNALVELDAVRDIAMNHMSEE